ncbi:hypothetical protein E1B28_011479 [Marasmius oreades]|uniref:Translocon-associated protein subunit alpha n=1 Tax=Marasmius oreades TaxID=181124 RepID=A0A9P7RUC7_9AGAR|nr:uncharacterized protein E1B28_011479 [Marasmius oreades]KAG7089832.1 hypothetical protein E1B28_011479 [Marasmius oreades]
MRFLKAAAALCAVYLTAVSAVEVVKEESGNLETDTPDAPETPELVTSIQWPESNPFGHVVNGEKNALSVLIENKTGKNITVLSISGSVHTLETEKFLKNLTALAYNIPLVNDVKIAIPYNFYSEFKPGDLLLNIWVDHLIEDEKERVLVYESVVTIVEPEGSWFDFKLISTYLVVSALLGGLTYVAYLSFVPQSKKSKKANVSVPVSVQATGAGGYQEEWIPEHHKPKTSRKRTGGAVSGTSGDELSGAETSGAEGKKEKTRKRK